MKKQKNKILDVAIVVCILALIALVTIVFSDLASKDKDEDKGWIKCVKKGYLVPEPYDAYDACCFSGCIGRDKTGNQVNLTCGPCGGEIHYSPLEPWNKRGD